MSRNTIIVLIYHCRKLLDFVKYAIYRAVNLLLLMSEYPQ
jgi:hypothetical protein